MQPDILIFMSDQHSPYFSGYLGHNVDTPNMDRLCADGVNYGECYTGSPLCGPARCSMLSGVRPARSGIFCRSMLGDTTPTFLHGLVEAGYETILCGRMHFLGTDQCHGFLKHIAKDMTPTTWNYMACRDQLQKRNGVLNGFNSETAPALAGGGESPVLNYDAFVVSEAVKYLSEPHEKPQCLFVSLYGPHFPYVAPPELFEKYLPRVKIPVSFLHDVDSELLHFFQSSCDETMEKAILAAYSGMVERIDHYLGEVREAFDRFADERGRGRLFGYISDHGDQCGDRHVYGKETFYERSAKIPFLFAGDGIVPGTVVTTPVSLMDLGPTLLDLVGAKPMLDVDGVSLLGGFSGGKVPERPVISELMYRTDGWNPTFPTRPDTEWVHGVMVRSGQYKYMTYSGREEDAVFDLAADPEELHNLAQENQTLLEDLRRQAEPLLLHEEALHNHRYQDRVQSLMICYETEKGSPDTSMTWFENTEKGAQYPEICYKNPAFFDADGHPLPPHYPAPITKE